jgi:glycosyltransferase involved in cell wall biosynthesis
MPLGFPRPLDARPRSDVSVIVPVYNHERYIGAALASVLGQSVRPREILCIDDGSTDGSARVVEVIAREYSEIRFWSRPNRGAHHTLNEGIDAAVGTYVAILNSDDVFHPGRLARCLAVLDARPNVDVVGTGIDFVDGEGRRIKNPWYEAACAFHREAGDLGLALVHANLLMTTSNVVARRAVFDDVGAFDDLRYAHDLDFFLNLVAKGKRLAMVRRPLIQYRFHGANTISEAHTNVRLEWAAVAAVFARRLQVGADRRRAGPEYQQKLREIMDRHGLGPAVSLLLRWLERTPSSDPVPSPGTCLADAALRTALQEVLA